MEEEKEREETCREIERGKREMDTKINKWRDGEKVRRRER